MENTEQAAQAGTEGKDRGRRRPSSVFFCAARLHWLGRSYIVQELERAGLQGVVPSHGDILAQLFSHDSCKMSELARFIRRSKSTLTVLVEKLERAGYVQRSQDPEDQRGVRVCLTDKGRAMQPVVDSISYGLENMLLERLSREELRTLEQLLARCVAAPDRPEQADQTAQAGRDSRADQTDEQGA